jgi:hypothetical protein
MERQNHAYEAMKKTPEELVIWVIDRSPEAEVSGLFR